MASPIAPVGGLRLLDRLRGMQGMWISIITLMIKIELIQKPKNGVAKRVFPSSTYYWSNGETILVGRCTQPFSCVPCLNLLYGNITTLLSTPCISCHGLPHHASVLDDLEWEKCSGLPSQKCSLKILLNMNVEEMKLWVTAGTKYLGAFMLGE